MSTLKPFDSARRLEAQGRSDAEIRDTLVREGVSAGDVTVLMGSLGRLPKPRTNEPRVLAFMSRVARARTTIAVVFGLAVLMTVPLARMVWAVLVLRDPQH